MDDTIRLKCIGDTLMLDMVGETIDNKEFDINLQYLQKLKTFSKLYVNIEYLSTISNDTLQKLRKLRMVLKDKPVCIINVNASNNAVLNIFGIDKIFQLYMNKQDAIEAKRPIVNRKFKLVS